MSSVHVRLAGLDDTKAISRLFCAAVPVWQRLDDQGRVEDLPYDALTIYERWLHGGPWMSIETSAIFLSHLLRGAGIPFVAQAENGEIVGYTESYVHVEPAPFGKHWHLAHLINHEDQHHVKSALLDYAEKEAARKGCERLTAGFSRYDQETAAFYRSAGFSSLTSVKSYVLPAQTGQSFYKTTDHPGADAAQIHGWHMSVGRMTSARHHWETLWPALWDAIPQITHHKTHRLHFSAAGQEAFVCCQQHLYDPRSADIHCWSPKPLTTQLLTAIRDWAHRESYRRLVFSVPDSLTKVLGADIESTPYQQEIYAKSL